MLCKWCGSKLDNEAIFCKSCGNKVEHKEIAKQRDMARIKSIQDEESEREIIDQTRPEDAV